MRVQPFSTTPRRPSLLKAIGITNCLMIVALAVAIALTVASATARAQEAEQPLTAQIEDLKQALIALNRDLFILEEDLLYPSGTQVAVYLSMDVGAYFKLDAVELKIDDETVTHYLYTQKQVSALQRGGVQRLYMGNVTQGEHELTAFFIGIGPEKRPYKRAVTLSFEKADEPQALELSITDSPAKQQPEFLATVL
ncbi:hypothetical protein [Alteromonas sp. CYL-A6]|uniref:hypothetical protein n=1 Tax=Alteromonas nitratireducens TaxID=3390813 RepID=UPI0034B3D00D